MKNTKGSAHFYKVKEGKSYITKIILEIKSSGQRAIYNGDIEKIILPTTRVSKLGG